MKLKLKNGSLIKRTILIKINESNQRESIHEEKSRFID